MVINENRNYCYRICHINNLKHILCKGLCTRHHPAADIGFVAIGNTGIINARETTLVRIPEYGFIGEYVPFYFTPRSIMLYNIVTGFRAPLVPMLPRSDIMIIRCEIPEIIRLGRFFFTDGQANDALTNHYNDWNNHHKIDWQIIHNSNFTKSDGDLDRPRRYQAEFLMHYHLPVRAIDSIIVYNYEAAKFVQEQMKQVQVMLSVHIEASYFF